MDSDKTHYEVVSVDMGTSFRRSVKLLEVGFALSSKQARGHHRILGVPMTLEHDIGNPPSDDRIARGHDQSES